MKIRGNKVWDRSRCTWVALTPEENVRQWFLDFLIDELSIEPTRIATEFSLKVGTRMLRSDIVIFRHRSTEILAIVECKAPHVTLSQDTINQASIYNSTLLARYIIITNGSHTFAYDTTSKSFVENLKSLDLFG